MNDADFDTWWFGGGQDIATKVYGEQAEKNIANNIDERVSSLYEKTSIGDEASENNVFWNEVERLAKANGLHLN